MWRWMPLRVRSSITPSVRAPVLLVLFLFPRASSGTPFFAARLSIRSRVSSSRSARISGLSISPSPTLAQSRLLIASSSRRVFLSRSRRNSGRASSRGLGFFIREKRVPLIVRVHRSRTARRRRAGGPHACCGIRGGHEKKD